MLKLSTFSGVSPAGEPLVRLFHQGDSITKVASGYQPEVHDWLSTYRSDKKEIALLVNAMGASEYWGQNVNGDVFRWPALAHDCSGKLPTDYPFDPFYGRRIKPYGYRTFLNALPYVHHRNKDPSRAFGRVVVSTLNEAMKRVELIVLIDRELAAIHDAQPFVDRLDAGDFPDVSMGTRVPYDVCTICGHKSKTKDDYCEHIKLLGMNTILPDGRRVGVDNLHPAFFDISFVFVGADRTAKVMCKLASGLYVPYSVMAAEELYGPELIKRAEEDPGPEDPKRGHMGKRIFGTGEAPYDDGILHTNAGTAVDATDAYEEKRAFRDVTGYREGGSFTHEGKTYPLDAALDQTEGVAPHKASVADLKWVLEHDKADPTRVANADVSAPILVAPASDGRSAVIDGLHRLRRAVDEGLHELPAREVDLSRIKEAAKDLKEPPHREEYPYHGQYTWNGMTVRVENTAGTWRRGKNWATKMLYDYGEIEGSLGSDGDPVDVYVGPNEKAPNVYIVHQNHVMGPKKGEYDEDKVMLGFADSASAKKAYLAHYDKPDFFRSITEMSLPQFKKMIFRKEAQGEKLASAWYHSLETNKWHSAADPSLSLDHAPSFLERRILESGVKLASDTEKTAESLVLEDLFSTKNPVKRERVWKDKTTGDSSYHVKSGLGDSFSNLQKTASAEMDAKLAEVFKISEYKLATDKLADILKQIDPDMTTGRVVENLTAREECLPDEVLNEAGKNGVEKALSTSSMMGMVLKPEEFQRILLAAIGKEDLADELAQKRLTFNVSPSSGCEAPCGSLGPEHFDKALMQKLLPMLGGRSYLGPVVRKRIIRIEITPKAGPEMNTEDSPLLTKMGAAYTWYRNEMVKAATYAQQAVQNNPELHAGVYGVETSDLFGKTAEIGPVNMGSNTLGAVLFSLPLALMYSAALRRDIEQGEDVGIIKELIAQHPNLTALGTGAMVRELMKNPNVNRIVGNVGTEAMNLGDRIITGGA